MSIALFCLAMTCFMVAVFMGLANVILPKDHPSGPKMMKVVATLLALSFVMLAGAYAIEYFHPHQ